MVPTLRPITNQTVAIGAASAQSAAFGGYISEIRLVASVNCFVAIGSAPTATTAGMRLVADVPEYFHVSPGEQIAVIQDASGGTLYVTEMSR